jgi:hypothetical protein
MPPFEAAWTSFQPVKRGIERKTSFGKGTGRTVAARNLFVETRQQTTPIGIPYGQ